MMSLKLYNNLVELDDDPNKWILLRLLDKSQKTRQQNFVETTLIFGLPSKPSTERNNDKT